MHQSQSIPCQKTINLLNNVSSSVSSRVVLITELDSIKLHKQVFQVVSQICDTGHDPFCCIQVLSR